MGWDFGACNVGYYRGFRQPVSMHVSIHPSKHRCKLKLSRPIHAYWDTSIVNKHCTNQFAFITATAVLNTISDIYCFVLPLKSLSMLHISPRRRMVLFLVFTLGLTVCIAGCLRIWYTTVYFSSIDFTCTFEILPIP